MDKELIKMGNQFLGWCNDHDTAILTGGAIAGMAGALITSNLATVKTVRDLDAHPEWTMKEKVLRVAPRYIVPTVFAGGSCYCSVKAHNEDAAKIALLNGAVQYYENKAEALRNSMKSELTNSRAEKIEQEACKEDFLENAPSGPWEETGRGRFHVYEPWHGRKFNTTVNELERARNKFNDMVLRENYASMNDFYYELNLTPIMAASKEGYNVATGYMEFDLTHFQLEEVDGVMEPVCYLEYTPKPRSDFKNPQTIWRDEY